VLRTAFYFIQSAMTGFIVSVFPFRNRVSLNEAFEGLELGEGKLSRPVLRGPGGRKAAWLLGSQRSGHIQFGRRLLRRLHSVPVDRKRGRITFLDRAKREPGLPRSFQLTLGNCPSAWVLFQRLALSSDLTCGATLEQHKDGSEHVSATGATT